MNICEAFFKTAARLPDKVAIHDEDGPVTFSGLAAAVKSAAGQLRSTKASEHLGIMLPTSKEFAVAYFGALLAGKVPVPFNLFLQPDELKALIGHSGMDTVVSEPPLSQMAERLPVKVVKLDASAPCGADMSFPKVSENDIAALLYTTGTTGNSKGVMLTHRNLLANTEGCVKAIGFHEGHVLVCVLPLFHSFGLTASFVLPLVQGATVVTVRRFVPAKMFESVTKHSATMIMAVPSMFRVLAMTAISQNLKLPTLQFCISGGEALPADVRVLFEKAFGVPLLEGYGMTETSPVIAVNSPKGNRPGTVGAPLCNLEVKICGDDGAPVGRGCDGELLVRGPSVMKGYFARPDLTEQILSNDGWLATGDIARLDNDGFLSITGRKKEMIACSGEKIFPSEVESAICSHPKVLEVAVIGVPDRSRGEIPAAFVVPRENATLSADEIREFCRGKIAQFKIPKRVEIRKELPHNAVGKVAKKLLKAEMDAPARRTPQ
jgi:long-chain acyl-CoA synthetase